MQGNLEQMIFQSWAGLVRTASVGVLAVAALDEVGAAVPETNGSFTGVPRRGHTEPTALQGVAGYPASAGQDRA